MSVHWEDPPPEQDHRRRKPSAATLGLVEALKQQPGRWALVKMKPGAGGGDHLKRRGLEVVTRKQPDGRYAMYARWPTDA